MYSSATTHVCNATLLEKLPYIDLSECAEHARAGKAHIAMLKTILICYINVAEVPLRILQQAHGKHSCTSDAASCQEHQQEGGLSVLHADFPTCSITNPHGAQQCVRSWRTCLASFGKRPGSIARAL